MKIVFIFRLYIGILSEMGFLNYKILGGQGPPQSSSVSATLLMLRAMGTSLNFCRKLELEARKKIHMTLLIDQEPEAEKYTTKT